MLKLGQYTAIPDSKFSITIQVRDRKGNPTGKTKTYHTNNAADVSDFYERHQPRRPNKVNPKLLPKAQEADKLVVEAATYAEKKQEERK